MRGPVGARRPGVIVVAGLLASLFAIVVAGLLASLAAIVVVALLASSACAPSTYRFRGADVKVTPPPATFIAGTAKVEITPPPGFPLAGSSIAAGVARGYWSRLFARAFYFRDQDGRVIALVSADLYAVSAGLRLEVLRRVNAAGVYLPSAGFVLAATHTHHGPGGHMTAAIYNGFGAALPGFDRKFFDVLAGRLSDAVIAAATRSAPADLVLSTGYALGIQRNRAILPFSRNEAAMRQRIISAAIRAGVRCPGGEADCPRYQAVDPSLTALTVIRSSQPIGVLVMFAVHPTGMSHESPLFGADLVGHAMARLEERSGNPAFVAGFFNGAQGDVSPDWISQNRQDVLRLGDRLADAVTTVTTGQGLPVPTPRLRYAMREFERDWRDPTPGGPRLASRPLVGAATMGGAEDARTPFYAMGWRTGVLSTRPGCVTGEQGCKAPALGAPLRTALRNMDRPNAGAIAEWLDLTSMLGPPSAFPRVIPVSVIRFGDVLTLASVPVEVTTAMAWRIRESLGLTHRFALIGLANDYFSYTTTPEEYEVQAYEGASTLAGPRQGPAIEAMIKQTAAGLTLVQPADERVPPRSFHVGRVRTVPFGPDLLGPARPMIDEGLKPLWPEHLMFREGAVPRFSWIESRDADWSADRRVRVLDGSTHAEVEGPGTTNLLTMIAAGCPPKRPCDRPWTVMWLPSRATTTGRYYFEVHAGDGGQFCSPVFSLAVSGAVPVPDVGLPTKCPIPVREPRR